MNESDLFGISTVFSCFPEVYIFENWNTFTQGNKKIEYNNVIIMIECLKNRFLGSVELEDTQHGINMCTLKYNFVLVHFNVLSTFSDHIRIGNICTYTY